MFNDYHAVTVTFVHFLKSHWHETHFYLTFYGYLMINIINIINNLFKDKMALIKYAYKGCRINPFMTIHLSMSTGSNTV